MTGEEASASAKKIAMGQGWPGIEPVRAEYRCPWFGKGGWWNIQTNVDSRGPRVYVVIDDTTGEIREKQFFPRPR